MTERVGEDLDRFAALDGVRGDHLWDAAREFDAQASGGTHDDLANLWLGERLEVDLGTTRANRRVDLLGVARRRADQHEVGRRSVAEELLYVGRDARIGGVEIRRFENAAHIL